jgi:hypothetical protein
MITYSIISILMFGFARPTASATHLEKVINLAVAQGEYAERLREFEAGRGTPDILIEAMRVRLRARIDLAQEARHLDLYEDFVRDVYQVDKWEKQINAASRFTLSYDPYQQEIKWARVMLVQAVLKECRLNPQRLTPNKLAILRDELFFPNRVESHELRGRGPERLNPEQHSTRPQPLPILQP